MTTEPLPCVDCHGAGSIPLVSHQTCGDVYTDGSERCDTCRGSGCARCMECDDDATVSLPATPSRHAMHVCETCVVDVLAGDAAMAGTNVFSKAVNLILNPTKGTP